jgi:NO-binding membrane sensor protein with MHYT domain
MQDQIIPSTLDPLLAGLSYLVSVLGSFTALQLAIGIPSATNTRDRTLAIAAAGAVMGGGAIWSMHFIAMLAWRMDMPVAYDLPLTLGSALVAMLSCTAGLAIVGSGIFSAAKLALGGLLMGLGVSGMHYAGMSAMQMPATIDYAANIVILSVVIAIVASIVALWLAFNMRGMGPQVFSALIMGIAVCGMHYTGMSAASFRSSDAMAMAGGLSGTSLGVVIFVVVVCLLSTMLWIQKRRQHRRAQIAI